MATESNDTKVLKAYIGDIMERGKHHAGNVSAIALAIAGGIVWKNDTGSLSVRAEDDGEMKNVLWMTVNQQRYTISYNERTEEIEIRLNSTHGPILHRFTNGTPITDIEAIFRAL